MRTLLAVVAVSVLALSGCGGQTSAKDAIDNCDLGGWSEEFEFGGGEMPPTDTSKAECVMKKMGFDADIPRMKSDAASGTMGKAGDIDRGVKWYMGQNGQWQVMVGKLAAGA